MKLATLNEGGRDGTLVVVDRALQRAIRVPEIAGTLQQALEDWDEAEPQLRRIAEKLEADDIDEAFAFDPAASLSPLPRAYQWFDGGGYMPHMKLMRQARGAEMPPDWETTPLFYQGNSDRFLAPVDNYVAADDQNWGIDLEGEIGVITGDVPLQSPAAANTKHIKLLVLINDISLRGLIPDELAKGFGFFQSKPIKGLGPVAITPDEAGDAWDGGALTLPVKVHINGKRFGEPNAGEDFQFTFPEIIEHATKSRTLAAATVIGGGTVSNWDRSRGHCCIQEKRALETVEQGEAHFPYLKFGDEVRIEVFDANGQSLFGAIEHRVVSAAEGAQTAAPVKQAAGV